MHLNVTKSGGKTPFPYLSVRQRSRCIVKHPGAAHVEHWPRGLPHVATITWVACSNGSSIRQFTLYTSVPSLSWQMIEGLIFNETLKHRCFNEKRRPVSHLRRGRMSGQRPRGWARSARMPLEIHRRGCNYFRTADGSHRRRPGTPMQKQTLLVSKLSFAFVPSLSWQTVGYIHSGNVGEEEEEMFPFHTWPGPPKSSARLIG